MSSKNLWRKLAMNICKRLIISGCSWRQRRESRRNSSSSMCIILSQLSHWARTCALSSTLNWGRSRTYMRGILLGCSKQTTRCSNKLILTSDWKQMGTSVFDFTRWMQSRLSRSWVSLRRIQGLSGGHSILSSDMASSLMYLRENLVLLLRQETSLSKDLIKRSVSLKQLQTHRYPRLLIRHMASLTD